MTNKELQDEELEVLQSIYEGDGNFKQISPAVFQYKIGEDGNMKSFLIEISWPPDYPEAVPEVSMEAFYNKHVQEEVKKEVVQKVKQEADNWVGSAMTYTLFEWAKENAEELMENQSEVVMQAASSVEKPAENREQAKVKVKKEHLSKAQKRKMFDRLDQQGERPRGWDWVDIVKHLSQTGGKQQREDANS